MTDGEIEAIDIDVKFVTFNNDHNNMKYTNKKSNNNLTSMVFGDNDEWRGIPSGKKLKLKLDVNKTFNISMEVIISYRPNPTSPNVCEKFGAYCNYYCKK